MAKATLPTVLVSNDDGFFAEGLNALATALAQFARVVVVAPSENQSAVSQAITLKKPLRIKNHEKTFGAARLTSCIRWMARPPIRPTWVCLKS